MWRFEPLLLTPQVSGNISMTACLGCERTIRNDLIFSQRSSGAWSSHCSVPYLDVSSPRELWFSLAVVSPSADKRADQLPQLNSEPSKREGVRFISSIDSLTTRSTPATCFPGLPQSFLVLSYVLIVTQRLRRTEASLNLVILYHYNTTSLDHLANSSTRGSCTFTFT
jgi:hypothetical protein